MTVRQAGGKAVRRAAGQTEEEEAAQTGVETFGVAPWRDWHLAGKARGRSWCWTCWHAAVSDDTNCPCKVKLQSGWRMRMKMMMMQRWCPWSFSRFKALFRLQNLLIPLDLSDNLQDLLVQKYMMTTRLFVWISCWELHLTCYKLPSDHYFLHITGCDAL